MTVGQAGLQMVDPDEGEAPPLLARTSKVQVPEEIARFVGLAPEQRRLLMHVHELLGDIAFGTVVLVMQDGKVIQIETSEKIRLR
ncbi:MAG TPA: YezD family protein [Actinomycetota bacterium]